MSGKAKDGTWRDALATAFEQRVADVDAWVAASEDIAAMLEASGYHDAVTELRSTMGTIRTARNDLDEAGGRLRAQVEGDARRAPA